MSHSEPIKAVFITLICSVTLLTFGACKSVAGAVGVAQKTQRLPAEGLPEEQAHDADAFVESVGVATHLGYDNSPYYTRWPAVLAKLKSLGVHHIRDGFYNWPSSSPFIAEHQSLAAAGIKCTYVIPLDASTTPQIVEGFSSRAYDLEALEGPNECDAGNNCGGGGDKGVRNVVAFMPTVFAAGQALHVPVIGPSFTIASSFASAGSLSRYMTYNNLHVYFGGRYPGSAGWGDTDPEGHSYGSLAWWIDQGKKDAPNVPSVITESGYVVNQTPKPYTVPGDIGGMYTPRALLLAFNQGIKRTFLYELLDEFTSDNYGILRSDLSEKPAFTAVKNLLATLSDPGPSFAAGKLRYTISDSDRSINHTLLQKRDGSFWLVLWLEQSGYDVATNKPTPTTPRNAVLGLAEGATVKKVVTFNPDGSITTTGVSGSTVTLQMTDRISIVQISGR